MAIEGFLPIFFRLLEYYVRTEQMKKEGTDGKEAD